VFSSRIQRPDDIASSLLFCANTGSPRPGVAAPGPMTSPVHRARPWGYCRHLLGCKLAMVESFDQLVAAQPDGPEFLGPKIAASSKPPAMP